MSYIKTDFVEKLYQEIKKYETIIIHRHINPDPDAIGSQLGLKTIIQSSFPKKRVLAAGTITSRLDWLGKMDKVEEDDYKDALVIIVDTANRPRVDGNNYDKGKCLIKIDHHPLVDPYGDLEIVYPQASSVSEMIVLIAQALEDRLEMTNESAKLLYAGIVGDTGRFMYNSTSATTFEAATFVRKYSFDAFEINDRFESISLNEAKFHGHVYDNLAITENGVAHLTIFQKDLKEFQLNEEQTNSVINLPSKIEGVYSWVTFVELQDEKTKFRCRIRSKGPSINQIASKHDGGGHAMASGANAYSVEEINTIIKEMDQANYNYKKTLENN